MNRYQWVTFLLAVVISLGAAHAQPASPYAGQEHRAIKALSDQDIRDLLEARGMGLAKAAELNSYPGPMHVLQLAKELALSDAQRAATETLYAEMRDKAQPLGRRIVEAERNLDQAFVHAQIDAAGLRDKVAIIASLQGELRVVHLEAHLHQRRLLTAEQIARYDTLRGYGGARPSHHGSRHRD
jgi:Spy/CpxP family protein refolding chaperone